jgi:hypothetical protein
MEKYNISESLVVDFISSIETKKQEFNNASSIEEKKQIIKDVSNLWRQFIDQVKSEIRSKR